MLGCLALGALQAVGEAAMGGGLGLRAALGGGPLGGRGLLGRGALGVLGRVVLREGGGEARAQVGGVHVVGLAVQAAVAQVVLPEQAVVLPAAQARRREGALHQQRSDGNET